MNARAGFPSENVGDSNRCTWRQSVPGGAARTIVLRFRGGNDSIGSRLGLSGRLLLLGEYLAIQTEQRQAHENEAEVQVHREQDVYFRRYERSEAKLKLNRVTIYHAEST